ncbi:MAG: HAD-IC family P-type ATPase [Candidatus Lokiarchaeota archaeon]
MIRDKPQDQSWYALDERDILEFLKTKITGLTNEEARKRLDEYGPNELESGTKKSKLNLLVDQFRNPIILILIGAALISLIANKLISTYVILVVIIFNTFIGFFQEYKAEKSLETLKSMASPEAEVLRDCLDFGGCTEKRIKTSEIVPGDILLLDTGDIIPADARLYETVNLEIDESILTGESMPVIKSSTTLKKELSVAERKNIAFSGTVVTKGRGKAIVVSTGMSTEMGKIAQLLKEAEEIKTPLQKRISKFGIFLALLALAVSIIIFIYGIVRGFEFYEIFLFALSTMVSAIPEGLPAAISIALAIGVNKMVKRNAIVICTDKTGTLTTNQITTREILVENKHINITGVGFAPEGNFEINGEKININEIDTAKLLLEIITLCNDARLRQHELNGEFKWEIYGDPTEGSLIVASHKAGIHKEAIEEKCPRIDEIPFTSEQKYMATFHNESDSKIRVCVKGAPEIILNRSQEYMSENGIKPLTQGLKKDLLEKSNSIANRGLRVLAIAYQEIDSSNLEIIKENIIKEKSELIIVGFIGMLDPPRPEVKNAIETCKKAGIKVKMITGDHLLTAQTIAREIGLLDEKDNIISGFELDRLTEKGLDEIIEDTVVFARVSPLNKFQIVRSLIKKGHIVAMTGDGVNDAPALKEANAGIAMGITGTDVTKETADIILTDDNFASIVNAVEEGRVVFDNMKKIIKFLLTTNISEIIIVLVSLIFLINHPLIFTAILILWINLVTDGSLTITLAKEPKEEDIMDRPPISIDEKILNKNLILNIIFISAVMALGTISLFIYGYMNQDLIRAQTMAFIALAMFQTFNALNCRSDSSSLLRLKLFSNKSILYGVCISIILLILATVLPFFQSTLGTSALSIIDWILIILVSSIVILADEVRKIIRKRIKK